MTAPRALRAWGIVYLVLCAAVGAFYGLGFHADPTNPTCVAVLQQLVTLLVFVVVGGIVAVGSVATASGLDQREPWARSVALVLAGVFLMFGLVPGALVIAWDIGPPWRWAPQRMGQAPQK